jgi:hypothetical protein
MSSLDTAIPADDTEADSEVIILECLGTSNDPSRTDGEAVADLGAVSPASNRSSSAIGRLATLALAVAVALIRYLYSAPRYVFSLAPDEVTSGGVARFLAGGNWTAWGNIYRPGFPVLLAPFYVFIDDPEWQVRIGLMLNAAIAGVTMFWFVPLVRRLTTFSSRGVIVVAGVIAVLPASLSASSYVWAEPLVTLCFLATLLAVIRCYEQPRFRFAIAAVLWPAFGYTAHGRLLPLVLIANLAVLGLLARRKQWVMLLVAGVSGVGSYVAAYLFQRWIVSEVWEFAGDTNTSGAVLERLRHPLAVLDSLVGQMWYQLCASALLFGFGVVWLVRRGAQIGAPHERRDARLVLALTLPMLAVSVAFMSDRARADHVVYGRYNDAIVWPVLAVGACWLFCHERSERRKVRLWTLGAVAVLAVELALMLRQLHHLQLRVGGVEAMIAGITPATGDGLVRVFVVTGVALAAFGVLWLAARIAPRMRLGALAIVLGLVGIGGVRGWAVLEDGNSWAAATPTEEIEDLGIEFTKPIGVSLMPERYGPAESEFRQTAHALTSQWYLDDYRLELDNGPRDDVGPYVWAVTNDALLTRDGGTIVWLSPSLNIALWKEPEVLPDGTRNPAYDTP